MTEADLVLCPSFPKESITRHTWLRWDVGSKAFYSGDCGLRIEVLNTRQMDYSEDLRKLFHKDRVHLLFKSPSKDYLKHKAGKPCALNRRWRQGNEQSMLLI